MRIWHIQGRHGIRVKSPRVWLVILQAEVLAAHLHAPPVVGVLNVYAAHAEPQLSPWIRPAPVVQFNT